jgi:tRNA 2-thiouridine synthesizing protein A
VVKDEANNIITINAQNLGCPMPILKLKKGLSIYAQAVEFELLVTDLGAKKDVPAFCKQQGLDSEMQELNGILIFKIKRVIS